METRANYVLIGAFTLAVIAAAFGFVLWFQSLHTTKQRSPLRVIFEGPATGLRNGGSVNFNGIRIGEVISVKLDNPRRVVALAMVENNAPIRKDTMVGLKPEVADRYPSELSGGMVKRVALARALALDPELVFLDEPTSGLDPIGAGDFDELVRTLQRTLGLTVFMVTHDLDSLYTACDRIAVLGNGKIIAAGSIADMQASQHPWLRQYFHGKRARAVMG